MAKEQFERRTYRKSPGRQYGYDYDPLRGNSKDNQLEARSLSSSGSIDNWPSRQDTSRTSHPSTTLAPRPNLRRTRQLMRKSILDSKTNSQNLTPTSLDNLDYYDQPEVQQHPYEEEEDSTLFSNRYPSRSKRALQRYNYTPSTEHYQEITEEALDNQLLPQEMIQPETDYYADFEQADPLEARLNNIEAHLSRSLALRPSAPLRRVSRRPSNEVEPEFEEELVFDDPEYEIAPAPRRVREREVKTGGITRRKLLWGAGIAAIGGTAIAAAEFGPKVPQALQTAGNNLERQVQQAFNDGLAKGAEEARKEFINTLENLEGVSLESAIGAAKLTRVAYDVFVSPLVKLAATITGDFLDVSLRAFKTARGWLRNIGQDNNTMGALQTVLETWIQQVQQMPKQLQTVTDTDLDGAQSYLRALQRKIQAEKNALNNPPNQQQNLQPTIPTTTKKP